MSGRADPVNASIAERIIQNVFEALGEISTASGYLTDPIVEEIKQGGNPPIRDGLVLVGVGDPAPQDPAPVGLDEFLMPIGIHATVKESEDSSPDVLRGRLTALAADIRRALQRDVHRGELAVNTTFGPDQYNLNGNPASVQIFPTVQFRTLFGDPYRR